MLKENEIIWIKNFVRNHFKFAFCVVWFTFLFIHVSGCVNDCKWMIYDDNASNLKSTYHSFSWLDERIDDKIGSLEKKLLFEMGMNRAILHVLYRDLVKCMNYHAGCEKGSEGA